MSVTFYDCLAIYIMLAPLWDRYWQGDNCLEMPDPSGKRTDMCPTCFCPRAVLLQNVKYPPGFLILSVSLSTRQHTPLGRLSECSFLGGVLISGCHRQLKEGREAYLSIVLSKMKCELQDG